MILELPMDRETRIANRDFSFTFIGRLMDSLYSNEREREKKKERKKKLNNDSSCSRHHKNIVIVQSQYRFFR